MRQIWSRCNRFVMFALAAAVLGVTAAFFARLYDRRIRLFVVRYVNARIAGGDYE